MAQLDLNGRGNTARGLLGEGVEELGGGQQLPRNAVAGRRSRERGTFLIAWGAGGWIRCTLISNVELCNWLSSTAGKLCQRATDSANSLHNREIPSPPLYHLQLGTTLTCRRKCRSVPATEEEQTQQAEGEGA